MSCTACDSQLPDGALCSPWWTKVDLSSADAERSDRAEARARMP